MNKITPLFIFLLVANALISQCPANQQGSKGSVYKESKITAELLSFDFDNTHCWAKFVTST